MFKAEVTADFTEGYFWGKRQISDIILLFM